MPSPCRTRLAATALACLVLTAAATAAAAAGPSVPESVPVFEEKGGVIVIEVESCRPQGNWKAEKDLKGFTGKGYYTWRGGNLFRTPGKGVLVYPVRVAEDGKYHLAIRNRHDFHDSTEENDCWTRIDEGKWLKTFSPQRGKWTWGTRHEHRHSKKIPAFYELKAGLHLLQIAGRSKGFSIDRIHLYRDGACRLRLPTLGPLPFTESPAVAVCRLCGLAPLREAAVVFLRRSPRSLRALR
ncbi:MAG: hypothetical protein R6X20_05665 [Phycisphaerae bacterium]